jgi:Tfp pilus assembly protein PilO
MTGRDRIVLAGVVALALLAFGWIAVVSPERNKAAKLQTEISGAASQLASAESQLSNAKAAQARYSADYAAIVALGKAVPPGREVPSLVYELAQASDRKHVELASIVYSAAGAAAPSSGGAGGAAAPVAGFTQMPFTFVFNGTYNDLYSLLKQLNRSAVHSASGGLSVSGRLLTIQSIKLAPVASAAEPGSKKSGQLMSGTISATAYVLPQSQSLTAGATPTAPGSGSLASASSGASSPTTPAIARVAP